MDNIYSSIYITRTCSTCGMEITDGICPACKEDQTMTLMSYAEAQNTLLRYAPEASPLFADRFSRWPIQGPAYEIVRILEDRIRYFSEDIVDPAIALKLQRIKTQIYGT